MSDALENYKRSYNFLATHPGERSQKYLGFTMEKSTERQDQDRIPFVHSCSQFSFPGGRYILMDFMGFIQDFEGHNPLDNQGFYEELYMISKGFCGWGVTYTWSHISSKQVVNEPHSARLLRMDFSEILFLEMMETPTSSIRHVKAVACFLELTKTFNESHIYGVSRAPVLVIESDENFLVYRPPDIRFEYGKIDTNYF